VHGKSNNTKPGSQQKEQRGLNSKPRHWYLIHDGLNVSLNGLAVNIQKGVAEFADWIFSIRFEPLDSNASI
jgi:hypothetical protein